MLRCWEIGEMFNQHATTSSVSDADIEGQNFFFASPINQTFTRRGCIFSSDASIFNPDSIIPTSGGFFLFIGGRNLLNWFYKT